MTDFNTEITDQELTLDELKTVAGGDFWEDLGHVLAHVATGGVYGVVRYAETVIKHQDALRNTNPFGG